MALLFERTVNYALKVLDAADIVREAIYRQLRNETDNSAEAKDHSVFNC
jgi:hypothetical protein